MTALAVCFGATASAQASTEAALQRLRADIRGSLRPTLTSDDRAILALGGMHMPLPASPMGPAVAMRDWLHDHGEAFGLDPVRDAVVVADEEVLPGGWRRVTLAQVHEGLPVLGADARAMIDPQGHLRSVQAGFVRGDWPVASVRVTPETAMGVVRSRASDLESVTIHTAWVGADAEHGPRLVWVVRGRRDGRPSASWVSAVDASVAAVEEDVAHAAARFYPTDPNGALQDVTLHDLLPGPGLSSTRFRVEDNRVRPIVSLGLDDYRYPPTDSMFDQVNAFALTQRFLQDELRGRLGWAGPREAFVVRVNYPTSPYAALTSGRFVQLSGAIPGFVHEVARAADIVFHELTHAVLYDRGILSTGPNREAGALHEGLADYFAAVATNDVRIGEWLYPAFPQGATRVDQPLPQWSVANYDHVGYAGGDAASVWGNGMILSSALWDLRRSLGETADSLALESLEYLPSQPTWVMFGNALLQADRDHHGERNAVTIFQLLAARGWRGGVVASAFTGPLVANRGSAATFIAQPCCSGLYRGHYRWSVREWCRGAPCEAWRSVGEGDSLTLVLERDTEVGLRVTSVWGDTVLAEPHFVNVELPMLRVVGPTHVVLGTEGVWRAAVTAVGPYQVYWSRRESNAGAVEVPVGTGAELRLQLNAHATLRAELRDGRGRSAIQDIAVTVVADRPPTAFVSVLGLSHRTVSGSNMMESRVELPADARLQVRLFDVRGVLRRVVRDAWTVHGAHVLKWDGSDLGSGVYFLDARAQGERRVVRCVVVR